MLKSRSCERSEADGGVMLQRRCRKRQLGEGRWMADERNGRTVGGWWQISSLPGFPTGGVWSMLVVSVWAGHNGRQRVDG